MFVDDVEGILVHSPHTADYITYINQKGQPQLIGIYQSFDDMQNRIAYEYVLPIYRKHIKTMIEFIVYLHANEVSFSLVEFSFKENLLVHNDVIKFWRLTFMEATQQLKYCSSSGTDDKTSTEDYRKLTKHIKRVTFFKAASKKSSYFSD
ncbi:Poly-beta-1,6-N-acetyl-D-glucosamine N-deacetylase [Striga asiatica]|uniref:Poly-beta-1,6-N-acetyl-D-glucosamine N-deacetylase n=1 Tax=Striga asiatica TaxID=4170 RepID=A0A5A7Q8S5_STRAF|nr:Poly-beta-1,6-N-acetyl-D-glucosamine N-deacetylase [Striga asiatica]